MPNNAFEKMKKLAAGLAGAVQVNIAAFIKNNDKAGFLAACADKLRAFDKPPHRHEKILDLESQIATDQAAIHDLKKERDALPVTKQQYVEAKNNKPIPFYERIDGGIFLALGFAALLVPAYIAAALITEVEMEFFQSKAAAAPLISILAAAGAIAVATLRGNYQFEAQRRFDGFILKTTIVAFIAFLWVASSVALGGVSMTSSFALDESHILFCAGILDLMAGGTLYISKVRIFGPKLDIVDVEHPKRAVLASMIDKAEKKLRPLQDTLTDMLAKNEQWEQTHNLALSILSERFELTQAQFQAAKSKALLDVLQGRTPSDEDYLPTHTPSTTNGSPYHA